MTRLLVTLDGRILDADQPILHSDDSGFVRGDGCFETILVRAGRPCVVGWHLARLATSAAMLDLPEPNLDIWRNAIDIAVREWGVANEGMMRLLLTRGRESGGEPTALVTVTEVPERIVNGRSNGIGVVTLERGFSTDLAKLAPWQLLGAKTLSYATNMAALRHAAREGADDVVFLSTDGKVLEGPRSTVVIARGRTLLTPPTEFGILPGTTQRALFAVAQNRGYTCEYLPLERADLDNADGLWLMSSVALGARVHTLDGRSLAVPAVAAEIAEMVDQAVATIGG
ncbi:MAG: aminodeoxychorismate lyase [Nocardiaceae bacterium]|nr:aminodeoxychorismate lyase [Nocardiaceae bacterium]